MAENMPVFVEVWPLAADEKGIWLTSGDDAWRSTLAVPSDSEPHAEVELVLGAHGASQEAILIHSTSWRVDGPRLILTYVAVLYAGEIVRNRWTDARPISLRLADAVGNPTPTAPTEPPIPRYIDVLMHGIRHLRFLMDNDATAANALRNPWPNHLGSLSPALAGMYSEVHG